MPPTETEPARSGSAIRNRLKSKEYFETTAERCELPVPASKADPMGGAATFVPESCHQDANPRSPEASVGPGRRTRRKKRSGSS